MTAQRMLPVDEDVYRLIQSRLEIGEPASPFLRNLLLNGANAQRPVETSAPRGESSPVWDYVASEEFRRLRNSTDKFLGVLAVAHKADPRAFAKILDVSGRNRRYFARTEAEIAKSGKSTHPRQIPGTAFWAMTNADTAQKMDILRQALVHLGHSSTVASSVAASIG